MKKWWWLKALFPVTNSGPELTRPRKSLFTLCSPALLLAGGMAAWSCGIVDVLLSTATHTEYNNIPNRMFLKDTFSHSSILCWPTSQPCQHPMETLQSQHYWWYDERDEFCLSGLLYLMMIVLWERVAYSSGRRRGINLLLYIISSSHTLWIIIVFLRDVGDFISPQRKSVSSCLSQLLKTDRQAIRCVWWCL